MANIKAIYDKPLRSLDNLGHELSFYIKVLLALPRSIMRYPREILRILAEVTLGSGALAVIGGTVGVIAFLTFFTGTNVGLQGYAALDQIGGHLLLDVGERRIGVAISDPSGTLARPLTVVSTSGLDRDAVERAVLERSTEVRSWNGQEIRWKRVTLPDGTSRAKPEYEDVAKAARALGRTPFEVRQALDQDATKPS